MKSDDYKRGVRDMAAAMRKEWGTLLSHCDIIHNAEKRLLADPVPKFAVGQVVALGAYLIQPTRTVGFITGILPDDPVKYYVLGDWRYESNLRALTPLEATGKE